MKSILTVILSLFLTSLTAQLNIGFGVNTKGPELSTGYRFNHLTTKVEFALSLRNNSIPHRLNFEAGYQIGSAYSITPSIGLSYHMYEVVPSSKLESPKPNETIANEYAHTSGLHPIYRVELARNITSEAVSGGFTIYTAYSRTLNLNLVSLGMRCYF